MDYASNGGTIICKFGGKFLVRCGKTDIDVIVRFLDIELASACLEDKAYKAIEPVRQK